MLAGGATQCRIVYEVVQSQVLRQNRLGDPTGRVTPVILPPSYDKQSERRYPVIYLLAALTGTGWQLLNRSPFSEALDERLCRLYRDNPAMPEVIVVLPDCFTALGGSQYVNSPALGRYEDHVTQEVVPQVDRCYRTLAAAAHRGVVGRSSGGIGALWLAMNHPGLFGAVASHAGDGYFRATVPPELLKFCRRVSRYGGPEGAMRHFLSLGKQPRGGDLFDIASVLVSAAAYSPDETAPLGFVLPVDWQTAAIDETCLARWLRFDPVELCSVEPYRSALSGLRLLFLDAGTRDEYYLDIAAQQLAARLRAAGIAVQHEEFDDGHMNTAYRFDRSLPLLAEALSP